MTIGQTIAAARHVQGLSVEDLSDKTRIRPALLTSIEADDFAACGGDTYARGHIRSIATALGIDGAVLLDQFGAQGGVPARVASAVEPIEQPTRIMESANRADGLRQLAGSLGKQDTRGGGVWLVVAAVLGIALLGAGLFYFFSQRSSTATNVVPSVSPSMSASPTPTPTPSMSPTTSASPSEVPSSTPSTTAAVTDSATPDPSSASPVIVGAGTTVQVTVTGQAAWVSVAKGKGGEKIFEGMLTAGDTKVFTSDSTVYLVVGDAGAVTLKVNGVDLGAPGSAGQVVRQEYGSVSPTA